MSPTERLYSCHRLDRRPYLCGNASLKEGVRIRNARSTIPTDVSQWISNDDSQPVPLGLRKCRCRCR